MTLVKWNKTKGPVFPNLLDNFIGNDFFTGEISNYMPVNISETTDNFIIELSAPGFKKEDFKIEVDNGSLTVSGEYKREKEDEEKTYTRKEFTYGSFKRSFNLPEIVNDERIDAQYKDGVLKLVLAKKEEAKPKPAKEIKIA